MAANVLVIENDIYVRDFLCLMFESDGHAAAGVATYPEAMAHLKKRDVHLAVTDGFTAVGLAGASRLRCLCPTLRLLILSRGVACATSLSFHSQSISVLPKLCSTQAMLETVRQILSGPLDAPLQDILERGRLDVLTTLAFSKPQLMGNWAHTRA